jgi:hypothetical protein
MSNQDFYYIQIIKLLRAELTPCNLKRIMQTAFLKSTENKNQRARRGNRE